MANPSYQQNGNGFLNRAGGGFAFVKPEEIEKLVAGANGEQTRLLVRVLWTTGCRISEALDISTNDIDFSKNTLLIKRRKRRKAFHQVIPIPSDLTENLRMFAWAKKRTKIFTADRISAYRSIRRLGERVLGRALWPHQFRHGRAYHMVSKNVHPMLVSRALGHASLSSSLAYYHPTDDDLRDAMKD